MKKIIAIHICLIAFGALFVSCTDEQVSQPVALFEVSSQTNVIHESVVFTFTGEANQVSIFTGDKKHEYDLLEAGNTGFVVNKGTFSYAYKQPGTYKVVLVAANYSASDGVILKDTASMIIQIVDNDVSIQSLSCPKVLYDEIAAHPVNEEEWLVVLPQKIMFTGRTAAVTSKQRLAVKLASDSTTLLINDTKYNATTQYELNTPLLLNVSAHSGDSKDYRLYMLRYPEFADFKINDEEGVLQRSEYNYDKMVYEFTLPEETDKTALKPVFTLSEGQEVYHHDNPVVSGSTVIDFSSPVVFVLSNTFTDKPQLVAETEITVVVQ
jgi:PKD repeat protein